MKLKTTLYIYMRQNEYADAGYELIIIPDTHKWVVNSSDVKIGETTVEFEVELPTPNELIGLAINTFEANIVTIMETAQDEMQEIRSKIKELQLITHQN